MSVKEWHQGFFEIFVVRLDLFLLFGNLMEPIKDWRDFICICLNATRSIEDVLNVHIPLGLPLSPPSLNLMFPKPSQPPHTLFSTGAHDMTPNQEQASSPITRTQSL